MLSSENVRSETYRGYSYSECLEKVQAHWGDGYDYIASERKQVKIGGFLGIGAKAGIEVRFSLLPKKKLYNFKTQQPTETFAQAQQRILQMQGLAPQPQSNPQIKEVLDAVKSLKQGIEQIQKADAAPDEHPSIIRIEQMLENNEFSNSFIKVILDRLRKEFSIEELNKFENVEGQVVKWIADSIQIKKAEYTARPQVIILVGPTGVGKTTTVAKIAASYVCPTDQKPKRVGIITVDSFRIAARQQIETYGLHMEIPVVAADSPEELRKSISMFNDNYDYILIDTIGYSPNDVQNIKKMKETLNVNNCAVATYLTMSASTKLSDMRDIIKQYEIFDYESVIVTKIDETSRVGNVISALKEKNKSCVYLTNGQHVPRDFENATVLTFLNKLTDFKVNEYTYLIENIGDK